MKDTEAVLDKRASYTRKRLGDVHKGINAELTRAERRSVIGDHTCVYATGSGGRLELSRFSDLDAFILRDETKAAASNLDAIVIQSAVLRTSLRLKLPRPSRDGHFLRMHTVDDMLKRMGTPVDDALNTFTARMLLLLESKPLYGEKAYEAALGRIVDKYWRYSAEHPRDHLPLVLLNDIIRYWRIVLLNYEAKNSEPSDATEKHRDADRRLRSYKLRFSRCLTCYSAIAFLLQAVRTNSGNLTRDSVLQMIHMTPLERLQTIAADAIDGEPATLQRLRELYCCFLTETAREKPALLSDFGRAAYRKARAKEARDFGDNLFELLQSLGRGNPLYRFLLV